MSLLKSQAYIDGEWVDAVDETTFDVKNPGNGETVGTVPNMNAVDAEKVIRYHWWSETWIRITGKERSIFLEKWHDLLKRNAEELVEILKSETGKPLAEVTMEVNIAIEDVEFFAEEAKRINCWRTCIFGLITPWNFSLALSVKKMATALAAGCTCVLKPSEDTPLAVLAVVELAHQAGFPKGVINVITSDWSNASAVDKALCSSRLMDGISFTGSTQVCKILYEQSAPNIKKLVMELDGNIPFLVFNSANIDKAVQCGIRSTFLNCGEICVASYIFLVQEDVHDQFVEKFSEAMKNIKAGVTMGPLINKTQFQRLCSMVDDAKSKGANILIGGRPATKLGELFYEPTLITDVTDDMQVFRDEVFGPVASVMKFKTEGEGVALANDTKTKLYAYSFMEENSQMNGIMRLVQAPKIRINDAFTRVKDGLYLRKFEKSGIGKGSIFYGVDEYCRLDNYY